MPRVLVVDDEDSLREMLRQVLQREGFEVIEASDGDAALEELERGPIDLVITDILMPRKQGIEVIRAMQGLAQSPKIIAISGAGGGGMLDFLPIAESLGVQRTLSKPFDRAELIAAVREVLC